MATKEELDGILNDMHYGMAEALLKKIKDGSATASDLNVARQFLKDNGVDGIPAGATDPANKLAEVLPFSGTDDEQVQS